VAVARLGLVEVASIVAVALVVATVVFAWLTGATSLGKGFRLPLASVDRAKVAVAVVMSFAAVVLIGSMMVIGGGRKAVDDGPVRATTPGSRCQPQRNLCPEGCPPGQQCLGGDCMTWDEHHKRLEESLRVERWPEGWPQSRPAPAPWPWQ
jgi:hypothetical protein